MFRYLLLVAALPVSAEIQKCVDLDGETTYQDRPCQVPEHRVEINRKYANELPLATSPEAQKVLSAIAEERKARRKQHIRQRNRAIREFAREYERKKARCREIKEEYHAMQRYKRRNGSPGRDYESRLIKRMREACSS